MAGKCTLGQEIMRLRKGKGISQFELAVRMNWSSTSPIIQIEKDRRIPKIETLEKMSVHMELDYRELYYLLGLAGYIPPTRLPHERQIIKTLCHIADYLSNIRYPAYIIDYRFRFWLFNPAFSIFSFGESKKIKHTLSNKKSIFDIIFDSRLGFRQYIRDVDKLERVQILIFKSLNSFRQHEDFFQAYPECMNHLLPEDYNSFARTWSDIDVDKLTDIQRKASISEMFKESKEGGLIIETNGVPLHFNVVWKSILHLGDLFHIVNWIPVNLSDNNSADLLYEKHCTKEEKQPIALWECVNDYL